MVIGPFRVEEGHVLTFARAIGDESAVYRDPKVAEAAGLPGVAAPPTFVQASAHFDPDFHLRPKPGEPWWGSGRSAGTYDPTQADVLHAEQHFEYHRPLVAGDVLTGETAPGRTWEKQGRRGGTLRFGETITVFRDEAGKPVVTTTTVWVRTDRQGGEES